MNERPSKKPRLVLREDEIRDIRWMRHKFAAVKKSLEEVAYEVREEMENIRNFNSALEELQFDVAGIRESIEEKASEARDERQNLTDMLEELLSEIRQE